MHRVFRYIVVTVVCVWVAAVVYLLRTPDPVEESMAHFSSQCPFCTIAKAYPPTEAQIPNDPNAELISPNCHLILSTKSVLAFLDIMPITQGHVLVIPRTHRTKLGDLQGDEGAALGMWLPAISRATMRALGNGDGDWNVVQNNGATAAQVVPHVHYHIIPRNGQVPEIKARSWTMFGRGQRDELDDEDGVKIAALIRKELAADVKALENSDSVARELLSKF